MTTPSNSSTELVSFEITSGESTDSILERLTTAKLINSKEATLVYLRINNLRDDIKAGKFQLDPKKTPAEIVLDLTVTPAKPTKWITIKEGLRYSEIVADLRSQSLNLDFDKLTQIISQPDQYKDQFSQETREFLDKYKPAGKNLEGFLFPDTYNVELNISEVELVDLLVKTLSQKLTPEDYANILASKYRFYDILIIASITEREANTKVDYPIVAGIFYNRLRLGMKLESDVTTLYGLNRRNPEPLRSELLDTKNLYNTRALAGLTPTPIANSGIDTIRAAIKPQTTDYLFFIAGSDGKIYYAKNLTEHNRNIRDHL
jgi:UPF0755 protein